MACVVVRVVFSSLFSGVGVGAWETSGVSAWVSDWGTAREGDQLAHTIRVPHVCTLGTRGGYCAGRGGRGGTFRVTHTRTRANPNP
jgi:hypothetical protein